MLADAHERRSVRLATAVLIFLAILAVAARTGGWFTSTPKTVEVAQVVSDDAGDDVATTHFDKAMVRKRTALAIHPGPHADRAKVARELRSAAAKAGIGTLTDASFAVFSADLLEYLVPEMTFVLDEGVSAEKGEAFIRDFQPADVAFALVEPVLVHDLTFAVIPAAGLTPQQARTAEDKEGVLSDSLNYYETTVQRSGLTVRYFGAILSDGQVLAVREAMGRAAGVSAAQVQVEANLPGPGVDLSNGVPNLQDPSHHHS